MIRRAPSLLLALCLTLVVGAPPASAGWGARTKKTVDKPKTKRRKRRKRRRKTTRKSARTTTRKSAGTRTAPKGRKAADEAPLSERVDALLARRRWSTRDATRLMRRAVAGREMALALRLAEAIADNRRAAAADLVDAATILGQDQRYPVQLRLWQRAGRSRRVPRWLRRTVDEGWFDALMAAGQHKEARKVIDAALRRAPLGTRFSLFERLVAWGRVVGEVDEVRERLLAWRDPDATVLGARLVAELDGDEAALALLQKAFRRFPGHRALQKALIDGLSRQGDRKALAAVVKRVVKLSPGDPMPWLRVVDAHVLARDRRAARKLIDRLLRRYARHDVLIEALIDREQRLGEDRKRLTAMFEALLKAGPNNPSYVEAYGEWLLTRGRRKLRAALTVLARLERMPHGRYEGMRRTASILQAHGHVREAQAMLLKMKRDFPKRKETYRLLAILFGQTGREQAAETGWMQLIRLPDKPEPEARRMAGDARRSLIALYRKTGWLPRRLVALGRSLDAGKGGLGDVLLYLELVAGEAELGDVRLGPAWLEGKHPMLTRFGADPEVALGLGQADLRQRRLASALARAKALLAADADRGRTLLMAVVERSLMLGQTAPATDAEALLLGSGRVVPSQVLRLGDLHLRAGDTKGATRLYRRAARDNPRDTRAVLRLAGMFRQGGQVAEEAAALRSVVLRTVDADELGRAGQRLLTLAMVSGTAGDLLRWLDAVTPKHPRRSVIERFRLLAYDAWLRSARLERLLGNAGKPVGAALLGEALASGDLALRVRALRQAAQARRRLPPALASRLLKDPNASIRRLTILALAASGALEATKVLVEMEDERDWQVRVAQLLAFARLPSLPEAEPFLVHRLRERNTVWASLAALTLGRVGGPAALRQVHQVAQRRSALRAPTLIALGALLGRLPKADEAEQVVATLTAWSQPERGLRAVAFFQAYAGLWALAATGRDDARAVLLRRAVDLDSPVLRAMAIRLAGAEKPPELGISAFEVHVAWNRRARVDHDIMRRVVMPWLTPDPEALRAALARVDTELAALVGARAAAGPARQRWCEGLPLDRAPRLQQLCSPAAVAPRG